MQDPRERPLNACRAAFVTRAECTLIEDKTLERIEQIRREIRVAVAVSTALTGIFISVLGTLIGLGVI